MNNLNLTFFALWSFLGNINTTLFNLVNYVYIYINSFYVNIIVNLTLIALCFQGLCCSLVYISIFLFFKKYFFNFLLFFSGLLKIHPILFYVGVIILICILLCSNYRIILDILDVIGVVSKYFKHAVGSKVDIESGTYCHEGKDGEEKSEAPHILTFCFNLIS